MTKPVAILICCAIASAAGICSAKFEWYKAGHRYDRSSNGNGNNHQNDD